MTVDASAARVPVRRSLVLAVMCVGMFLVQLDVTVVNVALPQIRQGFNATLEHQQWVVDSYSVVLASLLLVAGSFGDRFGHRRVVLAGLGLFAGASLVCGAAPTIGMLLAGRAVQGVGAALLLPATLAVIISVFPGVAEQARAVGIWAGVSALSLPAGPLLGGVLVSAVSWRAIFLINLPIVAIAVPATLLLVPGSEAKPQRRLDLPGALLAVIMLASVVYAVIAAGSPETRFVAGISSGLSVVALVAFLVRERRAEAPMLPLQLLRVPAFAGANLVAAAMNLVGIGTIFVATLYLQNVQHLSPLKAGTLLLPLFVPLAVLAPVTGRLTARFGPRAPMTAGLLLGMTGSFAFTGLHPDSSYFALLPALAGLGTGMGLLTAAVVAAAVRAAPGSRAGLASGVNNAARQAAGAAGIAIYGAVAGNPTEPEQFTQNLHLLGVSASLIWLAALGVTWLTIRPGNPESCSLA